MHACVSTRPPFQRCRKHARAHTRLPQRVRMRHAPPPPRHESCCILNRASGRLRVSLGPRQHAAAAMVASPRWWHLHVTSSTGAGTGCRDWLCPVRRESSATALAIPTRSPPIAAVYRPAGARSRSEVARGWPRARGGAAGGSRAKRQHAPVGPRARGAAPPEPHGRGRGRAEPRGPRRRPSGAAPRRHGGGGASRAASTRRAGCELVGLQPAGAPVAPPAPSPLAPTLGGAPGLAP
jgi:hypothetical protein